MKHALNTPELWLAKFPRPQRQGHKYHRGHAVIFGAPELTGATRLAAEACSRIGAGLVSVLAGKRADLYRTALAPDIMVSVSDIRRLKGVTAILGGSGGIEQAHKKALYKNQSGCMRVFDADAIPDPGDFSCLDENCILTPHQGEFERAFGKSDGEKSAGVMQAARACGGLVILKGPRTIIAHPDGRIIANQHASEYLAKAGTGDVLCGLITGLVAQGMPVFEAACAGVWIHGEAGIRIGPGLTAGDIANKVPEILHDLLA